MSAFYDRLAAGRGVCAHRGARSLAPENTLLALARAQAMGADLCEVDVRLDADGVPVLIHDDTYARTTDIRRRAHLAAFAPWTVGSVPAAEASRLDAGSWFLECDPWGTVADGRVSAADHAAIRAQTAPTLAAALAFCRARAWPINVEIKDETPGPDRTGLVRAVLDAVATEDAAELVLISSFNHERLREARRLAPDVARAALVEGRLPSPLVPWLHELQVAALHQHHTLCDPALIAELRAAGLRVAPWTVNEPGRFAAFMAAGAAFVCTDWPQLMIP